MSEMETPTDWPKSVFFSHSLMATAYCITAVVGYYYKGNDVPAYLPSGKHNLLSLAIMCVQL